MSLDNCPRCTASFIGKKIPKKLQKDYGTTHWRNEIGIDGGYIGIYDGVVAYRCHKCDYTFPRSNHPVDVELYTKYMNYVVKNSI